jgi:16S rRNA (guanine527-N7)-methyltransferase
VDATHIAELLKPFLRSADSSTASIADQPATRAAASLTHSQLEQILTYIDILLHWNSRINLTAVRRPEEIVTRHFGESLFAARHLYPLAGGSGAAALSPHQRESAARPSSAPRMARERVLDLGSGAGFPGLPLKIWVPGMQLTLIESNHKKATFLREIIRALRLADVNVFAGRAEDLVRRGPNSSGSQTRSPNSSPDQPRAGSAELVTLRAVEGFNSVLPLAAKLTAPAGRLALLIGKAQVPTALSLLPNFHWRDALPIPLSNNRVLLVGSP